MPQKMRLDVLLTERGLVESREQAQRLIRAGQVRVGGQLATKPGHLFGEASLCEVRELPRYVSRGGFKLEAILTALRIDPTGLVCVDVGASTGGFTDCLLQHGARRVYAADVGKGQLHWKLRNDARVVVMEQVNARVMDPAAFEPRPVLATADVSFISLTKILPAIIRVLEPGGRLITLIKPQFEAGRKQIEKGGVVRDSRVRAAVIAEVTAAGRAMGLSLLGECESPLPGPKGNIEHLVYWACPIAGERGDDT